MDTKYLAFINAKLMQNEILSNCLKISKNVSFGAKIRLY